MNVKLVTWTLENEEELTNICDHADRQYLANRLPDPYTRENARWWLNMVKEKEGTDGIFRAILADGEYVGNISVEKKSDVYAKDAEIGYMLLKEHWSKGIMTEAVRQICELAFEKLDIIRITGLVYEPNGASRKLLENNGFVLEGIMKQAVCKNDQIYDLCIYGMCV